MTTFYLGAHRPNWLGLAGVPLFVSHNTLRRYKTLPQAIAPWALDSGGFDEVKRNGANAFPDGPKPYAAAVRRYRDEIGQLDWAAPQDWMNEPDMLRRTGLTVAEHQRRTVTNYLQLRDLAPDLPFVPVVQGWLVADYLRCADLYEAAGVDLAAERVVGVGTVCRRQDTLIADLIFTSLAARGLRLHGFGVKIEGLRRFAHALVSSDSMAWSKDARHAAGRRFRANEAREAEGLDPIPLPPCGKNTCANCLHYALDWRDAPLTALAAPQQLTLEAA